MLWSTTSNWAPRSLSRSPRQRARRRCNSGPVISRSALPGTKQRLAGGSISTHARTSAAIYVPGARRSQARRERGSSPGQRRSGVAKISDIHGRHTSGCLSVLNAARAGGVGTTRSGCAHGDAACSAEAMGAAACSAGTHLHAWVIVHRRRTVKQRAPLLPSRHLAGWRRARDSAQPARAVCWAGASSLAAAGRRPAVWSSRMGRRSRLRRRQQRRRHLRLRPWAMCR